MAGGVIRVGFGLDDRKVRRALRKMDQHRKALGKVFRQLRPVLREDLLNHAEAEESPDGKAWAPRAPSTLAKVEKRASTYTQTHRQRRKRKMHGPLRESKSTTRMTNLLGQLPLSVNTGARKASLRARSKVKWSGVHNEGGVVGNGAHLPAREFVGFSSEFLATAQEELEDFVHEGWRRAG